MSRGKLSVSGRGVGGRWSFWQIKPAGIYLGLCLDHSSKLSKFPTFFFFLREGDWREDIGLFWDASGVGWSVTQFKIDGFVDNTCHWQTEHQGLWTAGVKHMRIGLGIRTKDNRDNCACRNKDVPEIKRAHRKCACVQEFNRLWFCMHFCICTCLSISTCLMWLQSDDVYWSIHEILFLCWIGFSCKRGERWGSDKSCCLICQRPAQRTRYKGTPPPQIPYWYLQLKYLKPFPLATSELQ